MCGFWDPCRNKYRHGQEWGLPAWSNMWAPQVTEDAKACVEGLENMLEHWLSLCAVSSQDPLVALHPDTADYKLNVVLAWCKAVSLKKDATWASASPCRYEGR